MIVGGKTMTTNFCVKRVKILEFSIDLIDKKRYNNTKCSLFLIVGYYNLF